MIPFSSTPYLCCSCKSMHFRVSSGHFLLLCRFWRLLSPSVKSNNFLVYQSLSCRQYACNCLCLEILCILLRLLLFHLLFLVLFHFLFPVLIHLLFLLLFLVLIHLLFLVLFLVLIHLLFLVLFHLLSLLLFLVLIHLLILVLFLLLFLVLDLFLGLLFFVLLRYLFLRFLLYFFLRFLVLRFVFQHQRIRHSTPSLVSTNCRFVPLSGTSSFVLWKIACSLLEAPFSVHLHILRRPT